VTSWFLATLIEVRVPLGQRRSLPEVLDEPSLDVRHSLAEWPSAGFAAEEVAEAELGRGREFIRGLNSLSGKAEKWPEGWTRHRAWWRLRPWVGLGVGRGEEMRPRASLLCPVVLDVPSGNGRRHAHTVAES
jgi:hypothetical protein